MILLWPKMSAYIGPSTKRNTAEQKTSYENSDQILALEVSLLFKSKQNQNIVCHNNISPPINLRYYCFATDRRVIRPP